MTKSDSGWGVQGPQHLLATIHVDPTMTLFQAMQHNLNQLAKHHALHLGPRTNIQKWLELGADKVLIQAIRHGIKIPLQAIPQPHFQQIRKQEEDQLLPTIQDYLQE
jgi:hypothetical protein